MKLYRITLRTKHGETSNWFKTLEECKTLTNLGAHGQVLEIQLPTQKLNWVSFLGLVEHNLLEVANPWAKKVLDF